MTLAVVHSLREPRAQATKEELADLELDVLGRVRARAALGGVGGQHDPGRSIHLESVRRWFDRPLREMEPRDADRYFGTVLRSVSAATRAARAQILITYIEFLELRHKVELHELTGRVVECPIDEMNRPRLSVDARLRIPPTEAELEQLFAGWRQELVTCRKFAPAARNYVVARLSASVMLGDRQKVALSRCLRSDRS